MMAVRLAIVTLALTAAGYMHVTGALERQSLDMLRGHVRARAEREGATFALAEENHAVVRDDLLGRLRALGDGDPRDEFDSRFFRAPSGVWHSRREGFDPKRDVGVLMEPNSPFDADFRRRVIATQDTLARLGPAYMTRFHNTWVTSIENGIFAYWPSQPPPGLDFAPQGIVPTHETFLGAAPGRNPEKKSVWLKPYVDKRSSLSMVSAVTPVYDGARFLGVLGHDLLLDALVQRTTEDTLEGSYNLILRDDGHLIAHPRLTDHIRNMGGSFLVPNSNDNALREIYELTRGTTEDVSIRASSDAYVAIARIPGPRWFFVTVQPKSLVERAAFRTARFILLGGLVSLFLELLFVYLILRRQVAAPLSALMDATKRVERGDLGIALRAHREDELGIMAGHFNAMAAAVKERDETQKTIIEERTRAEQSVRALGEELAAKYEAERERNEVLVALQRAVEALSTPVLEVWKSVIALPLIGKVDERRAELAMEKLLDAVQHTQCRFVILDLTGVDDVDQATAERLLRIASAVELLGARCMLTGIRPAVARSMVALDATFRRMRTLRTLEQALQACLQGAARD
jgi:anti-anti-sigma factor